MRYLSFSPWRVTGSEFIEGYQAGTDSFSDNESAKYAVNLLSDLGTKGYFEPGFASVDFTSACNLFRCNLLYRLRTDQPCRRNV